jgi:phage terminase large subunit
LAVYQDQKTSVSLLKLIDPTDRQREFLDVISKKDYVLYGGAGGGGKSYILRWWLVVFLASLFKFKGLRNVQVALLCEDYPTLLDRQISKIRFEFPAWLGDLREGTTKDFTLKPQFGGGVIALRNLDDPSKYQSAEFAAIAVDELTKSPKETFDFLRFRLRWPGVERPKFAGATNPGGIGHAWVKKLWVDHEFPEEMEPLREQFGFVQAKASDNPHLTKSYYQNLLTLPPWMAKAFAEGDWNIFAGQFFTNFSETRHTFARSDIKIEKHWSKWISMDWGYDHPSCVHWHAIDENERIYTYRELWESNINEDVWAKRISEQSEGECIKAFFLSPDAKAKRNSANTTRQQINDNLVGVPQASDADNQRVAGWRLMYQLLDADQWAICRDCKRLIECLPTLIRDAPEHSEDVKKVDHSENNLGDDAADSARYGLKTWLSPANKPLELRIQDRLADFAKVRNTRVENLDPHQIATMSRRAERLERGRFKHGHGGRIWHPQSTGR